MDVSITDSLREAQAFLRATDGMVITDIETTALTPGHGQLLCVAFAPYATDEILVWWPKTEADVSKLVIRSMVAHNASFEMKWLHSYGAKTHCSWDTMVMAHLLNEEGPKGLKDLGQRLLSYEDWSDPNVSDFGAEFGQFWSDRSSVSLASWEESKLRVSKYVAMDVQVTRDLLKWQRQYIRKSLQPGEDPVYVMRKLMIPAIPALQEMEDNRMPVRLEAVKKEHARVEKAIQEIERQLDESIPPVEQWPDWLKKTRPRWGTTNWTKWWLYEYQGALCPRRGAPTKTWPEGNPGMSQEDLAKIDHPAAKLLRTRSTLNKNLTGFLVPLLEKAVDGRVPTGFRLTGTVTGRLSSASPSDETPGINSQQIPRDKASRNLFGEPGKAWIEADYSQLELRVAARMAGEQTMIGLFEADEDIHTYMAKRIIRGQEMTKQHRSLAKGINFGFLYGMRATHFANYLMDSYGVSITRAEAEAFREEFFQTFSGLEPWYNKQRKHALEYGGVPNAFGRYRHLPKVYHEDFWIRENAFRQAINSPVQGTGSDFMLLSLGKLVRDPRLPELGAKLITSVHDSVCLTAPYKTAKKVGRIVKATLEEADQVLPDRYFLKADVSISKFWGGEPLATL